MAYFSFISLQNDIAIWPGIHNTEIVLTMLLSVSETFQECFSIFSIIIVMSPYLHVVGVHYLVYPLPQKCLYTIIQYKLHTFYIIYLITTYIYICNPTYIHIQHDQYPRCVCETQQSNGMTDLISGARGSVYVSSKSAHNSFQSVTAT